MSEPSAAADLARRIRDRAPTWTEETTEPGLWQWTDPDPDYNDRHVIVDGRDRQVRVLPPMEGKRIGPTVIGFHQEITVHVDLPSMVDNSVVDMALRALEAIGALPRP